METTMLSDEVRATEGLKMIYGRRAVRKYKNRQVDDATIERILDAGRMAPSAINKQPWRFFILTNKDTIRSFSSEITAVAAKEFIRTGENNLLKTTGSPLYAFHGASLLKGTDPIFHDAPVVIFITAPKIDEWAALDIGMCAQNMMLAAKALGLDSCPVGLAKFVEQTGMYYKLRVPAGDQVHLAVILGYGDEIPEIHTRKKDNVFFIDKKERNIFKRTLLL
ncbi:nitroreductase [uncultured Mucilaginibacter sp.]|uniref:nitroreductase n=1 Tax=uncultured Mucilaginibacter sp. TaxID=797541 RepID=UPI0025E59EE9|nr:nitroreductase [uncultured Mucilaginibacter sp.]